MLQNKSTIDQVQILNVKIIVVHVDALIFWFWWFGLSAAAQP